MTEREETGEGKTSRKVVRVIMMSLLEQGLTRGAPRAGLAALSLAATPALEAGRVYHGLGLLFLNHHLLLGA